MIELAKYKNVIIVCPPFFKLNVLILVRVVKEMTRMQQAKDSKTEQMR